MNAQFIMTAGDITFLAIIFAAFGLLAGLLIGMRPAPGRRRRPDVVPGPDVRPAPPWPPAARPGPEWPPVGDTFSENAASFARLERNVCQDTRPFRAIY